MNANNQQQLIAKYQELAEIYTAPNERPAGNNQKELRRWYRNCVLDCNNLVEILLVCEQLLTDLETEDIEKASMEASSSKSHSGAVRPRVSAVRSRVTRCSWTCLQSWFINRLPKTTAS